MIDRISAIQLIIDNSVLTEITEIELAKGKGYVLAEDVLSPIDMPPFNQSAMDGYAIASQGLKNYKLVGEIKAGDHWLRTIKDDEAVRIFTGAMTPNNCYAVVKQEDAITMEDSIQFTLDAIEANINVRPQGEQIKRGNIAAKAGTPINAGTIGYLTTLGVTKVKVHRKPIVSLVATGNELIQPGNDLIPGQIYESNTIMLQTALAEENVESSVHFVEDDQQKTLEQLDSVIQKSDVVIITGGISVGDYDFVHSALESLGTKELFYKVAQKPGKPLYTGTKQDKIIFGLPGNPAAALTCFYMYVTPAIRTMQAQNNPQLLHARAKLLKSYNKTGSLSNHLKARLIGGTVEILPKQSSAMLGDFTDANCIAILPGEARTWQKDEEVDLLIIPN